MSKTTQAKIVRDFTDRNFNDTDVERSFTAGEVVALDDGVFANYSAAGLAAKEDGEAPAPVEADPASKSSRSRA